MTINDDINAIITHAIALEHTKPVDAHASGRMIRNALDTARRYSHAKVPTYRWSSPHDISNVPAFNEDIVPGYDYLPPYAYRPVTYSIPQLRTAIMRLQNHFIDAPGFDGTRPCDLLDLVLLNISLRRPATLTSSVLA